MWYYRAWKNKELHKSDLDKYAATEVDTSILHKYTTRHTLEREEAKYAATEADTSIQLHTLLNWTQLAYTTRPQLGYTTRLHK